MDLNSKIYIAGHRGLVGSAILRRLEAAGYRNLVVRTSAEPVSYTHLEPGLRQAGTPCQKI